MRLTSNGLRIARVDDDGQMPRNCDLSWRVRHVDALAAEVHEGSSFARVEGQRTEAGLVTHHVFGTGGFIKCRFSISPDGSDVLTSTTPRINDCDVVDLFSESVMRTILVRRGLASLHAAALVRDGGAILLLGHKGAGKSTLSAALQMQGWRLLADHLVRIDQIDGIWQCFPGHRRMKLRPDAARALGYPEDLGGRWASPEADGSLEAPKVIVEPPNDLLPLASAPIAAIFTLKPRRPEQEHMAAERARPAQTVAALLSNATPDPLSMNAAASAVSPAAISGLARQAQIHQVTLPDRLADLHASAKAVAAMAAI